MLQDRRVFLSSPRRNQYTSATFFGAFDAAGAKAAAVATAAHTRRTVGQSTSSSGKHPGLLQRRRPPFAPRPAAPSPRPCRRGPRRRPRPRRCESGTRPARTSRRPRRRRRTGRRRPRRNACDNLSTWRRCAATFDCTSGVSSRCLTGRHMFIGNARRSGTKPACISAAIARAMRAGLRRRPATGRRAGNFSARYSRIASDSQTCTSPSTSAGTLPVPEILRHPRLEVVGVERDHLFVERDARRPSWRSTAGTTMTNSSCCR